MLLPNEGDYVKVSGEVGYSEASGFELILPNGEIVWCDGDDTKWEPAPQPWKVGDKFTYDHGGLVIEVRAIVDGYIVGRYEDGDVCAWSIENEMDDMVRVEDAA